MRTKLIFSFILVVSCSSYVSDLDDLQNEILVETSPITCPDVKFIENLDRVTIYRENRALYNIKFNEVKWKCYFNSSERNTDNIDLFLSFQVNYIDEVNEFQTENFSFLVALLNENNEIISKEKFNRSFLSKSKSEIIQNKEGLINIKVRNSRDGIYNHKLLIGFYKNIKD
tara:strand:+ start:9157 stop:9669 length:513 start_codon:yes stop_codon:yes gene_type:complete